MYYAACERLANERPELREAIAQVDELLAQNANALVTIDLLRTHVEASGPVLETLFEELTLPEAFGCEQVRYCPEHDQAFALDETCDLCEDDSAPPTPLARNAIRPPRPMPSESGNSDNDDQTPVRVLISYSHDSPEHAERVLSLSNQLRDQGVDCVIDQYSPVPTEGWPLWMEREIAEANIILCLCSEEYCKRFSEDVQYDVGKGVAWEANLIRNAIYQDKPGMNSKFHPIQFDTQRLNWLPRPLQGKTVFVPTGFSLEDAEYEKLYRFLTNQPSTSRRPLGSVIKLAPKERKSEGAPPLIAPSEAVRYPSVLPTTQPGTRDSKLPPRAIFVLPCLLAVVLLIMLYAAFGPESDFQGEVSVYGFPVTSGEITLREKGRSRPVEKTSINESGRFILHKTREVASAQLDFQLDEPAEIISPDQALKEKTNLHPVIPWEEIKRAFRDGKGKELVERAKTLGYSLEIEATYRKLTDKNIGSRFFLMSESEIVRDAESGSNGGAQVLLIDCDVETIPNPALAGPLRIRGIPASYSDLSASKELFLKHCIIVVNGQPYGN